MLFNDVYKNVASEVFVDNYIINLQRYSNMYMYILNKYGKIACDAEGTILLDVNDEASVRNYVMYGCEFISYLNAVTLHILDTKNNNLFYDDILTLINEKIKEYEENLYDDSFDLNIKIFSERTFEYEKYEFNGLKVGFSIPKYLIIKTEREKFAAIFADHTVSKEIVPDFVNYQEIEQICGYISNIKYAEELFFLGLKIYDDINKQYLPYITGEVINIRKSKGLCPDCGGSYKGLFKKICSICGANKR